jgi:exopolysaccharide production protein ExoF
MSPVAPAHSLQGSSNVSKFLWRAAKQVLIVAGLVSVAVTASWASSDQDIALSVGDVVSFDFLDDTLPAETLTIGSDGRITLPLLGDVSISGVTVAEASAAIRKAFIDRRYFVDPQFSLSVSTFRPIYVLGDVKSPGSFPFQPALTVEQAVALAGGHMTGATNGEERVVARARIQGEIDQSVVELGKEATAAARVVAQLDGRADIQLSDIPETVKPLVGSDMLQMFLETEQRILESDIRAFQTRSTQLSNAIAEVTGALENLAQLAENQRLAIASSRDDVARIRALTERGIKTRTDLSNVEREATAQESHLLEILNQTSVARRELSDLQRQLTDATDKRQHDALVELQEHKAEIEATLAVRRSKEEQFLLISGIVADAARESATVTFAYQIRRMDKGALATLPVGFGEIVKPGDTVIVTLERGIGAVAQAAGGRVADSTP